MEDSLLVLSIEVNLHCLIQHVLVKTSELKAEVKAVILNKTKHTLAKEQVERPVW